MGWFSTFEVVTKCYTEIIRVIKSKRMIRERNAACMEENKDAYEIFAGRPEWTRTFRPLRRAGCRREDNIRKGLGVVEWMHLAEDRNQWRALLSMVMNLRVP
jgi:hypothetical protein